MVCGMLPQNQIKIMCKDKEHMERIIARLTLKISNGNLHKGTIKVHSVLSIDSLLN